LSHADLVDYREVFPAHCDADAFEMVLT
ncbi:MAG: hypothetical protein RI942_1337, partial [Pseudomonadota bacterium]